MLATRLVQKVKTEKKEMYQKRNRWTNATIFRNVNVLVKIEMHCTAQTVLLALWPKLRFHGKKLCVCWQRDHICDTFSRPINPAKQRKNENVQLRYKEKSHHPAGAHTIKKKKRLKWNGGRRGLAFFVFGLRPAPPLMVVACRLRIKTGRALFLLLFQQEHERLLCCSQIIPHVAHDNKITIITPASFSWSALPKVLDDSFFVYRCCAVPRAPT